MAIEARKPPLQLLSKLRRALGGQSGWKGFIFQIVFVALVI